MGRVVSFKQRNLTMDIFSLPDLAIDTLVRYLDRSSRSLFAEAIPEFAVNVDRFKKKVFRHQWLDKEFPDTEVRASFDASRSLLAVDSNKPAVIGHWSFGSDAYALFANGNVLYVDTDKPDRARLSKIHGFGERPHWPGAGLIPFLLSFSSPPPPVFQSSPDEPFAAQYSSVSEAGLLLQSPDVCGLNVIYVPCAVAWVVLSKTARVASLYLDLMGKFTWYHQQRLSGRKHQLLGLDYQHMRVNFFETVVSGQEGTVLVKEKWSKRLSTFMNCCSEMAKKFSFNDEVAAFPTHGDGTATTITLLSLENGEILKEIGLPRDSPVAPTLKGANLLVAVLCPNLADPMLQYYICGDVYFIDLRTGRIVMELLAQRDASKEDTFEYYGLHKEDHLHRNKLLLTLKGQDRNGTFVRIGKIITEHFDAGFRAVVVDGEAHSVTWITDDVALTRHGHYRKDDRGLCDKGDDLGYVTKGVVGRAPKRVENDGVIAFGKGHFLKVKGNRQLVVRELREAVPEYCTTTQGAADVELDKLDFPPES